MSSYFKVAILQMPRLLGQLDRSINSKTRGCFDRNYWHFKIADFASARFQEATLTLAILHNFKDKDNPYFQNKNMMDWIKSSFDFWISIQNNDGSFNEWYPKEHSFVATAFSLAAITEAKLRINYESKELNIAIQKAAIWLSNHEDWSATNQSAGAALALLNSFEILKNANFKVLAEKRINALIKRQNSEGWFDEYGGADIGYLSLCISYLARYYQKSPRDDLKLSIEKAQEFLSYFVHPNFTFGGEYGSRNTEYIIPTSFEIIKNNNSNYISNAVRSSLINNSGLSPQNIDDRYLCYITYEWLLADINSKPIKKSFTRRIFDKNFPNSRLYVKSTKDYMLIINYGKGGAFSYFGKKTIFDSGIVMSNKGKFFSSSQLSNGRVQFEGNKIKISGFLYETAQVPMSPLKNIGIRLMSQSGPSTAKLIKKLFRDKLILGAKKSSYIFRREFDLDGFKVLDAISGGPIDRVHIGEKYSTIFIPSSRYFQLHELENAAQSFDVNSDAFAAKREISNGQLIIERA